jgi:hypothetical protein
VDADKLKAMIEEDDFGLLDVKVAAPALTEEQRLAASFDEVTAFVVKNGREPTEDPSDVNEFMLAARLKGIRANSALHEALAGSDDLGLLKEPEPPTSIAEAVTSDDLGLLASDSGALKPTHVPEVSEKVTSMPETVARRKPCEDFESFRPLFEDCHAHIRDGRRRVKLFKNEQQIRGGAFYVQAGVLVYIDQVGERETRGGKSNARLRCVYENGTESGILLRSLSAELYKNGRLVTEPDEGAGKTAIKLKPETRMAHVYVLSSLSDNPEIKAIPNLNKIGSTKQELKARIANASQDPTFLSAPVKVQASYAVPEGVEAIVESLLHKFFAEVRLDIWFENQSGKATKDANEWFSVPLGVIDEAVNLISSDSIDAYRYDAEFSRIVLQ